MTATKPKGAAVQPLRPGPEFPVLRLRPRTEPAGRVPLFSIGETDYTIPAKPGANIALKYLHIAAGQPCECTGEDAHGRGELAAYDYLLTTLLGAEGYKALREFSDLDSADLGTLIAITVKHTLGALEVPKAPASA